MSTMTSNSTALYNASTRPTPPSSTARVCVIGEMAPPLDLEHDYTDFPGSRPTQCPGDMGLKINYYIISIILTLVGNTIVILIVARNKRMRNSTNTLIVNLAVSDILVGLMCSWPHLGSSLSPSIWPFGRYMCKLTNFAQVVSLTSSVLTLSVIAGDRFFAIVHPLKRRMARPEAYVWISIIWLLAILVSIPHLIIMDMLTLHWQNFSEKWCKEMWPQYYYTTDCSTHEPMRRVYVTVLITVMYFVPILTMGVAYSLVAFTLWTRKPPGEQTSHLAVVQDKAKRKVVKMLLAVFLTFIICWTPHQVFQLYDVYRPLGENPSDHSDNFKFATLYIAYFNSALNPLLYAGFSDNFRKGFVQAFRCTLCKRNKVEPGDRDNTQTINTAPSGSGGEGSSLCDKATAKSRSTGTAAAAAAGQTNTYISIPSNSTLVPRPAQPYAPMHM